MITKVNSQRIQIQKLQRQLKYKTVECEEQVNKVIMEWRQKTEALVDGYEC